MEIELGIFEFIYWQLSGLVIFLGLVIGLKLSLKREGNSFSNLFLGSILLISSLSILNNVLLLTGIKQQIPFLYLQPLDFSLSLGPLIYFYVKSKLNPGFGFKFKNSGHFLFPVSQAIFYLFFSLKSVATKLSFLKSPDASVYFEFETIAFILSICIYTGLSYRLLTKEKNDAPHWGIVLRKWLKVFLKVFILLEIVEVLVLLIEFSQSLLLLEESLTLNYVQISIELLLLLWFSKKAWDQYFPEMIFKATDLELSNKAKALNNSTTAIDNLNRLMIERKIHQNPDLSLTILSRHLGLTRRNTSSLIKKYYKKSFNEFINDYRLQDVIEKLKTEEYEELTILAIAFDAGFSSKSTFYRLFRQRMNMSPREYINNPGPIQLI